MKQYCRYCTYCIGETDFVNVSYCSAKQKEMSSNSCKTENHCKDFVFNEIDAFNFEHKYKPIQKKEKIDNGQLELFDDSADK